MKKIKNVWELFKLDWQRIFDNKITLFLVIALMILPSLYAWFNIAALWDPYSNTGDIAIAVYSDDKTVEIMDTEVNVGDKIIENLKDNHTIGWRFVKSKGELDEGVKKGKYYAGIYLPSDFSSNLTSFIDGEIKKPKIEYSVNQKINAIAPKIADKGASTIQSTISNEFINVASETLLGVFNDVGFELDENIISINKIKSKILSADANMDEIDGYTKEIVELNKKMPEFKDKLNEANNFIEYLPEVDEMADKLVEVNKMMPEIEKTGKVVLDVQKKIPEIQEAGRQLKMIDDDFDDLIGIMDDTISEAKNAVGIIENAQQVIPDIRDITERVNDTIPSLRRDIDVIKDALPNVSAGVRTGLQVVDVISEETVRLTDSLLSYLDNDELVEEDRDTINRILQKISANLNTKEGMLDAISQTLEELQKITNSNRLSSKIKKLNRAEDLIASLKSNVDGLNNNLSSMSIDEIRNSVQDINQDAQNLSSFISGIDVDEIEHEVNNILSDVDDLLDSSQNISNKIVDDQVINRLDNLMGNTINIINKTVELMEKYQAEMPKVKNEIHSASTILNDNMDTIINAINKSATIYTDDIPEVKKKLKTATEFIEKDLPGVEKDLKSTLEMANDKFPQVEKAMSMADEMIKEDWPSVKSGIHKAADAIRRGEEEVDLSELITMLKKDAKEESDFISNPVDLVQNDIYPIPNYGSASAPFYTALCLWVGAVLLSSMATTEFHLTEEDKKKYSKRDQFLARMFSFLTIGFFQALIVSLGNLYLLKIYCVNPLYHVLFSLFVGFVFMMMVYILVALLGNLGKGAAVIILVLSISGGGGNFPIEMSGPFFRAINPFLPFTHAVNLIRESVGGVYYPRVFISIAILLFVAILFFIVGFVFYPPVKKFFKKLNTKLQEGHFLH